MTWIARRLIALALTCAVAPAAMAQDALAKRVSLDLKAMAPAEVFKVLGDAVGMKVTVNPAVTTPVDILVRNVSARTALNTVCESIGCRWTADAAGIAVKPARVDGGRAGAKSGGRFQYSTVRSRMNGDSLRVLLKQPLPPGMKFENAALETVSARLTEALKTQITISNDDNAAQTVTADFSNLTLQAAIKVLLEQSGGRATWRITVAGPDGEKSPSIAIMVGGGATKAKKK